MPLQKRPRDPARVRQAIETLAEADLYRIYTFARICQPRFPSIATAEDLLQEAVVRTLSGERAWDSERVSFVHHLLGVMRSIAWSWGKQAAREVHLVAEPASPSGPVTTDFLAASEALTEILNVFEDDPEARAMIDALAEGMPGREVRQHLRLSDRAYYSTYRRIRRKVLATPRLRRMLKNRSGTPNAATVSFNDVALTG